MGDSQQRGKPMVGRIPKLLIHAIADGTWKQVTPDALRKFLGEDLDDLKLCDNVDAMLRISTEIDNAGYVDDPEFCMTRIRHTESIDLRTEFPRALFIAASIRAGDDVFVERISKPS
ncbi:MAG: hypothetical protein SFU86_22495 [Pirellulaceae bacterium]|nr:hypothetical protein [Pirellulaceae bacterium]